MTRSITDIYPISVTVTEAKEIIEWSPELKELVDRFARELLKKNPTSLEAQAVLVRTWNSVLENGRLSIIRPAYPGNRESV